MVAAAAGGAIAGTAGRAAASGTAGAGASARAAKGLPKGATQRVQATRLAANRPTGTAPVGATSKGGAAGKAPTRKGSSSGKAAAAGGAAGLGAGGLGLPGLGGRSSSTALPGTPARRLLVAEFALCMAVLAFSPLTDKNRAESPVAFMKRASAVMGVFFVLGLVATAGRGASRAAAGFGGLVTLALLVSSRSIFTVLATKFGTGAGELTDDEEGEDFNFPTPEPEPSDPIFPQPEELKPR